MKKFNFRYKTATYEGTWETSCSSPLTALGQFHKHMQVELAKRWDEYAIIEMIQIYNDGASGTGGEFIRSSFDLPNTPNPNLHPPKQETKEQQELIAGITP